MMGTKMSAPSSLLSVPPVGADPTIGRMESETKVKAKPESWTIYEKACLIDVLLSVAVGTSTSFTFLSRALLVLGVTRSPGAVRQHLKRMRSNNAPSLSAVPEDLLTSLLGPKSAPRRDSKAAKKRKTEKTIQYHLVNNAWSPLEDSVLTFAHSVHGNKWRQIGKDFIANRSDTAIRNRMRRLRLTGEVASDEPGWLTMQTVDEILVDSLVLWEGDL